MSKRTRELAKAKEPKEVRIVFNEVGTSGLKEYSGFVAEAYNSSLYWPTVQPLFARLRRSMPEIVMIRDGFTAWARNTSPQVDLPDKATDDDKRYQEFIYSDFENMDGGYNKYIDTTVNHVPFYGWLYFEVAPSKRDPNWRPPNGDEWRSEADDGLIGIRRLAIRDVSTFAGWEFDGKKNLLGMNQQDYPNQPVFIPLNRALHHTYGDPNNPEGLSPLEAVWRLERIRYGLEVVQGIGYEHAAGYLNVTKTEAGTLTAADKDNVKEAAKKILSAHEGNYAAWPYGLDGKVMDIGFAAAPALLEAIKHYSILSLSVYTMQWMALNTITGTGSFAAADDSSSMGVFKFNAMLDGFAAQYDQQVGKRLWEWNKQYFPKVTKRPKIKFSHITKSVVLGEMGSFLQQMDGILPLGEDDLLAIRKRSGFLPEVLPDPEEVQNVQTPEEKAAADALEKEKQADQEASNAKKIVEQSLQITSREPSGLRALTARIGSLIESLGNKKETQNITINTPPVNLTANMPDQTPNVIVNVPAQSPPVVNVSAPNVTNQVNPTPVNVQVQPSPVSVNVSPTPVTVRNEVQPAKVENTVEIKKGKRKATLVHKPDGSIEIESKDS